MVRNTRCLSFSASVIRLTAAMLGLASVTLAQESLPLPAHNVLGEPFPAFVSRLSSLEHPEDRANAITALVTAVRASGRPLTEDTVAYLFYAGKAARVSVASDLNRWNPVSDPMQRVGSSDFFFLKLVAEPTSRIEYKLVVDSAWILDPNNPFQTMGGFGPNSELRMPLHRESPDLEYRSDVPHGSIDTIRFASRILQRSYPVLVYRPARMNTGMRYPAVYVTDGGEYLSLARMNNILDNLIGTGRMTPVIGIFVDPRTDPRNPMSNMRMTDYAISDSFLTFVSDELRPAIARRYPVTTNPAETAIIGASLGGLISTYAVIRRPDVFGLCAAQSPAYQIMHDTLLAIVAASPRTTVTFCIETGTIHDAERTARLMRSTLVGKGYTVHYREVPESHNWAHWSSQLPEILMTFWGKHE